MDEIDKNEFDNKGYAIIKSLIPIETIDKIIEEIYTKNPENIIPGRLPDIWKNYDIIGKLSFDNKILKILKKLYNRKPIPFQTLNFYKGTEQKLHSDQIHFCSDPENFMCGVWIAFEDITMEKGPLVYYPGSHKMEFLNMQKLNLQPGDYPSYEKKIEEIIKNSNFKPEYGLIKKGDVIIWHANLIHGGHKRIGDLSRISMVIHYFFEGTRFWTPLLSSPNKIIYRDKKDFIDKRFYDDIIINQEKYKNLWVKYYKNKYKDLSIMSDEAAINHYYKYGKFEEREFMKKDWDWEDYKNDNKDILIKSEMDAINHYINHGMFKN
jgi:hypothetical protein